MALITMNLSGIVPGDSLNVSVAQNSITAGPVNVPSWGSAGTGGTITIVADRNTTTVAPDSVRFSVDLSEANFDTAGPSDGNKYDARLHDLIYLWDFDDTGTWTAPENVLPAWKNKNVAKGPWVAHMYTSAGTYNPSVLVIEPSTGKTATASLTGGSAITVGDPDTIYPAAKTIYVNPIGDSTFPGASGSSPQLNMDDVTASALASSVSSTGPYRIRFKRGASFNKLGLELTGNLLNGALLDSYGDSEDPRPYFDMPTDLSVNGGNYAIYAPDTSSVVEMRFRDLDVSGNFDTTKRLVNDGSGTSGHGFIRTLADASVMIHNVRANKGMGSTFLFQGDSSNGAMHIHLDDVYLTGFGGMYSIFTSANSGTSAPDNTFAATGVAAVQNPNAICDPSTRAPFRLNNPGRTYMAGCDVFHLDRDQMCVKFFETPTFDDSVTNCHSCSFEAGLQTISFQNNSLSPKAGFNSHTMNAIVDGCVFVGSGYTKRAILARGPGLTVRNCLAIQPAGDIYPLSSAFSELVGFYSDGTIDGELLTVPNQVYNNTIRCDRSHAQNFSKVPVVVTDSSDFATPTVVNNVTHFPNSSPADTTFAPLTETELWTPRYIGYRSPFTYDYYYSLPVAVADTESVTVPWWTTFDGLLDLDETYFSTSYGREYIKLGGSTYTLENDDFTLSYTSAGMVITNTSGETWPAGGSNRIFAADFGDAIYTITRFGSATDGVMASVPNTGSAAIGAATMGLAAYDSLGASGTARADPPSIGAWEAG